MMILLFYINHTYDYFVFNLPRPFQSTYSGRALAPIVEGWWFEKLTPVNGKIRTG